MTDQATTLELELTGLKGDHPLGFLAACGALRVLGPYSGVRLGWTESHGTWTAVLRDRVATHTTAAFQARVVAAIAQAAETFLDTLTLFKLPDAECPLDAFRDCGRLALKRRSTDPDRAMTMVDLLPGLGTDCLSTRKDTRKYKGKIVNYRTDLALTSGNQNFVSGLQKIAVRVRFSQDQKACAENQARIAKALVKPWRYEDSEHSLGWDPTTQRLHALRGKDPSPDKKNRSVAAAIFLASQALPLFPCFAVGGWLHTTGFHHDDEGDWFSWPIWRDPISLDALRTLVAHPFTRNLKERGVAVVYRCHRSHTGGDKGGYHVFGHPTKRPWPET
ncbi:type I-G CRISPR-associated protein, Cas3-extension family [Roseospira visakhapatnamensis]|uniref:Uncharacterized protein n=1 Tax=Roseospira visakhapatnamensis TaxID=390880 RepID=A0A7W6WAN2_9PROT|nr:hypothetical protein [Roseospira visakhapatnamensis]MBB4266687.1 hypothetical protein [Roseospira visakhapatnamensis]